MDDAIVARKDEFGENLRNTFASCKKIGKARIWAEVPIQSGSFMKELSKEKVVLHHTDESGKFANVRYHHTVHLIMKLCHYLSGLERKIKQK